MRKGRQRKMSQRRKATPIRCDGCGRWIWIMYANDGGPSRVFSALEPRGVSTRDKFVLHRDENPDCPRNQ